MLYGRSATEMLLLIEFATDLIRAGAQVGCIARQNLEGA